MLMFKFTCNHVRSRVQYSPILVYTYANVQGHVQSQKVTCSLQQITCSIRRSRAVPSRSRAVSEGHVQFPAGHVQSQKVTCSSQQVTCGGGLVNSDRHYYPKIVMHGPMNVVRP